MSFLKSVSSFVDALRGRRLEGVDLNGNRFFTVRDSGKYKRLVDYKDSIDPASIHPLWKHWLRHTLDRPPTEKEVALWECHSRIVREESINVKEMSVWIHKDLKDQKCDPLQGTHTPSSIAYEKAEYARTWKIRRELKRGSRE